MFIDLQQWSSSFLYSAWEAEVSAEDWKITPALIVDNAVLTRPGELYHML